MLIPSPERTSVSYSELDTWATCRMKWYWSYVRRIKAKRLWIAPTLGSAGHVAIAAHKQGEDWRQALTAWTSEKAEEAPFDEDSQAIIEIGVTVQDIMNMYLDHYQNDQYTPLVVEQEFSVKIPGIKRTVDGIWDSIVRDPYGDLWLFEHKWVSQSFRTEDQIDLDVQLGVYHYAALKSGYPIKGIIYNQILAKPLKRPKLTQKGDMSRADIRCTWEVYQDELLRHGLDPDFYLDMKDKLANKEFFRRYKKYRSPQEVVSFVEDLKSKIKDISRKKVYVYMTENRINCTMCQFRELCLERVRGRDVEPIIEQQYEPRRRPNELEERQVEVPYAEVFPMLP